MKKILIFSTAYLPLIGGAEIAVKELTDRLDGYEFDLITARISRRLAKQEKIGRVTVYRLGFGSKADKFLLPFLGLWRVYHLEPKRHYDIIFSLMASQASVAAAFFKMLYPGKRLVLNLQEGDEEEHLKRYVFNSNFLYRLLIKPWHLLVFKKADLITAISGYLRDRALANGVKCPVEVVPNGVNIEQFSIFNFQFSKNFQFSILQLKKKLGFAETDKILITVSRLVEKNAVGDIVEAMKYLPGEVKLLIAGDGPERKMLMDLARELKLTDRVIFLGQVTQADLPKYLSMADIFVRPSLSEGQGIAFLEAMAAGLPVIATPVGGIVDFLRDGETGWFCGVKDPQSIAEKIKYVFDERNKDKVREVINKAKEMVEKTYSWDLIAEKMKAVFNKLII